MTIRDSPVPPTGRSRPASREKEPGVRRRAPADQPAPRQRDRPSQLIRVRRKAPVMAQRGLGSVGDVGRKFAHRRIVRSGLHQQHPAARVLTEPAGQNTPSRPAPDHDDVVGHTAPWDCGVPAERNTGIRPSGVVASEPAARAEPMRPQVTRLRADIACLSRSTARNAQARHGRCSRCESRWPAPPAAQRPARQAPPHPVDRGCRSGRDRRRAVSGTHRRRAPAEAPICERGSQIEARSSRHDRMLSRSRRVHRHAAEGRRQVNLRTWSADAQREVAVR